MEIEPQKRTNHKDCFVKATNANGEVKFFKNGMEASRELGCSHIIVYKALNNQGKEKGDWSLEYISKDDPQCEGFKKEIEDKIRYLRKSLVEYAHDQMLKRKAFVEGEKAKRKAQHDQFVRAVRSMASCALQSLKEQLQEEAQDYKQTFAKYHAIVQKTMDGEIVAQWDSAYQAQRETNIKNIRQVVLGLRTSAGGYRWEFLV